MRTFIIPFCVATLVATSARAESVHEARVAALRATLARARISLEMRSAEAVVRTVGCKDVPDREQPSGCYRCTLAGDRDATDEVLAKVTAELDRYPTELLAQADIGTIDLCRRLYEPATQDMLGGIAHTDGRRVMIVVREGDVEGIVHHELLHMIESARLSNMDADDGWSITNPVGFSYDVGPVNTNVDRPGGFVGWYAATNVAEDRASVFEYMMANPDELCAIATVDRTVHAKVHIIWERMLTYAGGGLLMGGVAPCVRELAAYPPNEIWSRDRAARVPPELRIPLGAARAGTE